MLTEREVFELAKTRAKKLALGKKDINATLLKICTEHDPPKVVSSRIGWNGDELEEIKKVVTFHAERASVNRCVKRSGGFVQRLVWDGKSIHPIVA